MCVALYMAQFVVVANAGILPKDSLVSIILGVIMIFCLQY